MFLTSIEKQVARIRTDETSPKNTTLYFQYSIRNQRFNCSINKLITNVRRVLFKH